MWTFLNWLAPNAIAVFMSAVFLDSLRYKFADHPKTQRIFGLLNDWAESIDLPGLFAHTGLFSQYVIGSAELVAAALLLVGILPGMHHLQALGSLIALAIMLGAVNFHLWTPLTTDPNEDGGGLFAAACLTLVSSLVMLFYYRHTELGVVLGRVAAIFGPMP